MLGESKFSHFPLISKRAAAAMIDFSLEIFGGLLGSYFGALLAALATSFGDSTAEQVHENIWNGLGFGFAFWFLAISFVNRVLIQGLSRATLGKKIFNIELVSISGVYDWKLVTSRWLLSQASFIFFGVGYWFMAANKELRSLHDIVLGTDVVEVLDHQAFTIEYQQDEMLQPSQALSSKVIILNQGHDERPTASVIQLSSIRELKHGSLAEVIELNPEQDQDEKKVA